MVNATELQEAILQTIYEATASDPFDHFPTASIVEETVGRLDEEIEDTEIDYALRRLDEEALIDYSPALNSRGSIRLTPHGVEEYNSSHKTFIKTENWHNVLEFLQQLDKENPGAFWDGESIRDDLDMNDTAVDRNIWYLKEKDFIDVTMTTGDPPYSAIQITRAGRHALDTHEKLFEQQRSMNLDGDSQPEYDFFISHASENKDDFVRPLAESLDEENVDVWYDEFELEIGDSLRNSIDMGLANSKYGIIVLSEPYFQKDWTQYELDGLIARDIEEEKTVLPIWYQISKEEVLNNNPTLADRYAIQTDGNNISEVVNKLLTVIE